TRERYPSGLGRAVFLVLALATGASAIVLMRFAFRLRKHFDFSVYRPTKRRNLILERDYARKISDSITSAGVSPRKSAAKFQVVQIPASLPSTRCRPASVP